jgi:glycine reductase|tara:strand:- start:260 stop:466 length:207 start_codon:yes stop_codon:yes gene_type:complete
LIASLHPLAQDVGANRIVEGKAIPHPLGDPNVTPDEECAYRRRVVEKALQALACEVTEPTVFGTDGDA